MADGRMLKTKISVDERVADLASDTHRMLFTWGIAHLDIAGRISGSPREFKAKVAPMLDHITKEVVQEFFRDAAAVGLVQWYGVDGKWALQYPGFGKNQTLRHDKEAASTFPPPPEESRSTPGVLPEESRRSPGVLPEESRRSPGVLPSKGRERKGKEEKEKKKKRERDAAAKSAAGSLDFRWDDFEELRRGFPRPDGEAEARKAWENGIRKKLLPPLADLLAAVEKQKQSQQWADPVFVPKLVRWLRERRWKDVLPAAKDGGQGRPPHGRGEAGTGGACAHDLNRRECKVCRDYVPDGHGGWRMPRRGEGEVKRGP